MTTLIRKPIPTPLETEYKNQLKQSARNGRSSNNTINMKGGQSHGLPEDIVTLSSGQADAGARPDKLKPSLPVTYSEKQALQTQFSIYG
jgi:hypothetical protein